MDILVFETTTKSRRNAFRRSFPDSHVYSTGPDAFPKFYLFNGNKWEESSIQPDELSKTLSLVFRHGSDCLIKQDHIHTYEHLTSNTTLQIVYGEKSGIYALNKAEYQYDKGYPVKPDDIAAIRNFLEKESDFPAFLVSSPTELADHFTDTYRKLGKIEVLLEEQTGDESIAQVAIIGFENLDMIEVIHKSNDLKLFFYSDVIRLFDDYIAENDPEPDFTNEIQCVFINAEMGITEISTVDSLDKGMRAARDIRFAGYLGPVVICSARPESELRKIIAGRGMFGSPQFHYVHRTEEPKPIKLKIRSISPQIGKEICYYRLNPEGRLRSVFHDDISPVISAAKNIAVIKEVIEQSMITFKRQYFDTYYENSELIERRVETLFKELDHGGLKAADSLINGNFKNDIMNWLLGEKPEAQTKLFAIQITEDWKVLIVDDTESDRAILRKILEKNWKGKADGSEKIAFKESNSIDDAIEILEADPEIKVVIMDWRFLDKRNEEDGEFRDWAELQGLDLIDFILYKTDRLSTTAFFVVTNKEEVIVRSAQMALPSQLSWYSKKRVFNDTNNLQHDFCRDVLVQGDKMSRLKNITLMERAKPWHYQLKSGSTIRNIYPLKAYHKLYRDNDTGHWKRTVQSNAEEYINMSKDIINDITTHFLPKINCGEGLRNIEPLQDMPLFLERMTARLIFFGLFYSTNINWPNNVENSDDKRTLIGYLIFYQKLADLTEIKSTNIDTYLNNLLAIPKLAVTYTVQIFRKKIEVINEIEKNEYLLNEEKEWLVSYIDFERERVAN